MSLTRREFMRLLAAASAAGMAVNGRSASAEAETMMCLPLAICPCCILPTVMHS